MSSTPNTIEEERAPWRIHLFLFVATIASVVATGFEWSDGSILRAKLGYALRFAGALLGVLTVHEAGHYIAARYHKVDASLPYFIPLPLLGFGTMGAIIRMRGSIPTRKALLDIGASGPLAGLAVAIPLYAWGVAHSSVTNIGGEGTELGNSILLTLLDHVFGPTVPAGMEPQLSPVAFGAWAGMLVTMINLMPVGQLDGGHVAYALFGPRQNKFGLQVHRAMLVFAGVSLVSYVVRDVRAGFGLHHIGDAVSNSLFWFMWFEVLALLGTWSARSQGPAGEREAREGLPIATRLVALVGLCALAAIGHEHHSWILWACWFVGLALFLLMEVKGGVLRPHGLLDHPPTGAAPLDPVRTGIAIVTLAFFVLLFMPTPFPL